jgi:hypothetical protein
MIRSIVYFPSMHEFTLSLMDHMFLILFLSRMRRSNKKKTDRSSFKLLIVAAKAVHQLPR